MKLKEIDWNSEEWVRLFQDRAVRNIAINLRIL